MNSVPAQIESPPPPRALIAEDEPLLAAGLVAELKGLWPELQIATVVGDGFSAVDQALALRPDLCFLDIRMPGCSGLDAARALIDEWHVDDEDDGPASTRPFPLLVFVTAYDEHALAAFEAQAVDYLVKPVARERLATCVQRLQSRLADRRPARPRAQASAGDWQDTVDRLQSLLTALPAFAASHPPRLRVIQAGSGSLVHLVPLADVIYFEAADKYLRVVTADREFLIRQSLRELLPQLDGDEFWQVHRGTVVRATAIATARREESGKLTLTLRGRAEKLVASRAYAHLFRGL